VPVGFPYLLFKQGKAESLSLFVYIDVAINQTKKDERKKKMICVEIDELTPCLRDVKTGDIVETEVIRIKRSSFLSKFNKNTKWYISWADLLKENEIYALVVKGSVSIQGMVAVRPDCDMKAAFVSWMVAAPHNNSQMLYDGEQKEYSGVGGHLFAIASQISCKYGFGGAISGFAANSDLMSHYCDVFNAEPICMLHPYQIFISEEEGEKIRRLYDYEWTDEII